jgi:hypothetical protein
LLAMDEKTAFELISMGEWVRFSHDVISIHVNIVS